MKYYHIIREKLRAFWQRLRQDTGYRKQVALRSLRIILLGMAAGFALVLLLFLSVWAGLWGKLPRMAELASIENQVSSEVYAIDGELLGKYFIYDRSQVSLEQISPNVINSLIATEDARFYRHRGIDYRSLGRVFFKTLLMGETSAGGGSTLSQQLAKNLYTRQNNGIMSLPVSKFREFIIAHRLERIYSKEDILVLYLNTVPLGENVFGISAASLRFFNKNPRDLKVEEAAVLIGMLKATSFYNPRRFPERALQRRNTVIGQLQRYDYITAQQADSLRQIPLTLDYNPMTHNQGPAPYFREKLRLEVVKILEEYNARHQTQYNLYTDGLRIYTTIDYQLQLNAERALRRQLAAQQKILDNHFQRATPQRAASLLRSLMRNSDRYRSMQRARVAEKEIEEAFAREALLEMFSWEGPKEMRISPMDSIFRAQQIMHAGLVSVDASNGHIRAWVGGIDFRYFQYDHVQARRQAGSTFKPFVYVTALQMGVDPCEYVSNEIQVYEDFDDWSPQNASRDHEGYYSMLGALARSVNTISAHYISQTGVLPVIENARKAGIRSPLPPVPSLALGTADVSLLEMTLAYAPFLNEGQTLEPIWLLRIEDKNGTVLWEDKRKRNPSQAWEPHVALLSREMLSAVVDSGTAGSLRSRHGLQGSIAGKTGTTQNNADTWFVGFSPQLITGVWTGLENPAFAALYGSPLGSGGSAVPVWGDYMREVQRSARTRKYAQGSFSPVPDSLALQLQCAMFLEELPTESWWENIFGTPDERHEKRPDRQRKERPSRLRRFFENIF